MSEHSSQNQDSILITNLQLPAGIKDTNAWTLPKEQPALVSIRVSLSTGFDTAAASDALDTSTLHYGVLAKAIRALATDSAPTVAGLHAGIAQAVEKLSALPSGGSAVQGLDVTVHLPKAAMFGEGIDVRQKRTYGQTVECEWSHTLRGVRTMTLVGVNDYERTGKQPVVASLEVCGWNESDGTPVKGLEAALVESVQKTDFETLETLATHVVAELKASVFGKMKGDTRLRLVLEKPQAIAFADCPGVEVVRMISKGV